MTKQYVLDKINQILEKRIENKTPPYHVEDLDLYGEIISDVKSFLNALYKDKVIDVGKTLNGHFINLKNK